MTIENPNLTPDNPEHLNIVKLKKRAAVASITVATTLAFSKMIAYFITDSVSLLSSLMDSTFDLMASSLVLFSILKSSILIGKEHKYGYGKLEALAAMGQAVFIIASAGYLLIEATHRFVRPKAIVSVEFGIEVMLLSIALTIVLISYQRYIIKKTRSVALKADHLHYKGDLLMNIGVIAALLASTHQGWIYADPIFASCIALILFKNAYDVFRESMGILLDKELPAEERQKIIDIVSYHPQVCAIHDLRTRDSGTQLFIEFHMEVDENMTVGDAHDITEKLEQKLYQEFPRADVIIHEEPCGIDDRRVEERRVDD